jgi:hypothetical protein
MKFYILFIYCRGTKIITHTMQDDRRPNAIKCRKEVKAI